MSDLVTISIDDNGIADVKLNRAEKYNSLSNDMIRAIDAAGRSLIDNRSVRAVVLSGNGKGFCAGIDVSSFSAPDGSESLDLFSENAPIPNIAQNVAWVWKQVPVPVICAIHGVAFGGGLQIALGADIRIASPDARLSVMEIKWGLIPDMAGSQTLRDLVRLDIAKELTFTGRIVEATEAQQIGLVTKIAEQPYEAAMAMAAEIAGKSPDAIATGKRLLERTWHGDEMAGLKLEQTLQKRLIGKPAQIETIMANMEKRAGKFPERTPFEDE